MPSTCWRHSCATLSADTSSLPDLFFLFLFFDVALEGSGAGLDACVFSKPGDRDHPGVSNNGMAANVDVVVGELIAEETFKSQ